MGDIVTTNQMFNDPFHSRVKEVFEWILLSEPIFYSTDELDKEEYVLTLGRPGNCLHEESLIQSEPVNVKRKTKGIHVYEYKKK